MKNWDYYFGLGFTAELIKLSKQRWNLINQGNDTWWECDVHKLDWWPGDHSDSCIGCLGDARLEQARTEWRKRRAEHILTSDLPFSEPKP